MVENHLKEMILKNFDPKKADTIFTEEGDVKNPTQSRNFYFLLLIFFATTYFLYSRHQHGSQR